jgi:isocitrate dehydrogenase kinase/phosphatase
MMVNATSRRARLAAAARVSEAVWHAFEGYQAAFVEITRRAPARFDAGDWRGMQADAVERLDLYPRVLRDLVALLTAGLGAAGRDAAVWRAARARYAAAIAGHPAAEIAETFFNSVTRRLLHTVGVNPAVEFLDFRLARVRRPPGAPAVQSHRVAGTLADAVRTILETRGLGTPLEDPVRDAGLLAARMAAQWGAEDAPLPIREIQLLEPVFFRRKGAYLVGRAVGGERAMPLAIALVHGAGGIRADAVLTTEDDVSILFSFTRSDFHADVASPAAAITFLRALMPRKPVAELYTAIGHHRHGKTEFYRDLRRHLLHSHERFDFAPGAPGMVMIVFAMPGHDVVFKVIRDSFPPPKQTTPDEVKRRYQLVFAHDRAGRLVEAQQFEGLAFPEARFAPGLLAELKAQAGRTVRCSGTEVTIAHLYTERRVRPLDLYLADVGPDEARQAVLDCGQAVRDLAATNVFPGDILPKNFGVTRHGRLVFYDYDELRLLSECRFREYPEPRFPEDELAEEPWFHVGPNDIFPAHLGRFVPFAGSLGEAFLAAHGDLYTVEFWRDLQERNAAGEVVDIYPYPEERRLAR